MMNILSLILFLSTLGLVHQATSQDVDVRAASSDVQAVELDGGTSSGSGSGGGQTRNIYSQRYLSPHRMMHFGKRPTPILPPTIADWQRIYGHNNKPAPIDIPYLFSLELDNGQTLRAIPEDTPTQGSYYPASKDLLYSYERAQQQVANGIKEQRQQQLLRQLMSQQQPGSQRSQKLLDNDEAFAKSADSLDSSAEVNGSSFERAQISSNNGQDQQLPNSININTRSLHSPGRSNTLTIPKSFVSSLLYSRQGSSSMPNFGGSYNKKAEPKDNFFMHFGRK